MLKAGLMQGIGPAFVFAPPYLGLNVLYNTPPNNLNLYSDIFILKSKSIL
jgi:hypothetical protein